MNGLGHPKPCGQWDKKGGGGLNDPLDRFPSVIFLTHFVLITAWNPVIWTLFQHNCYKDALT